MQSHKSHELHAEKDRAAHPELMKKTNRSRKTFRKAVITCIHVSFREIAIWCILLLQPSFKGSWSGGPNNDLAAFLTHHSSEPLLACKTCPQPPTLTCYLLVFNLFAAHLSAPSYLFTREASMRRSVAPDPACCSSSGLSRSPARSDPQLSDPQ